MTVLGLEGVEPLLAALAIAIAVLMLAGLRRVHAGPTVFDRLVAVSLISVNGVALIAILGFLLHRPVFFLDIALSFAMLVFLVPITLGRYFERTER